MFPKVRRLPSPDRFTRVEQPFHGFKLRKEPSGYHWFNRVTGTHIIVDEVSPLPASWSTAPRILSIALSNVCDLACNFCYRPRTRDTLEATFVQRVAAVSDRLGTLEVSFGGGEPLLYPELVPLCEWLWRHTSLGISITSHGHYLTRNIADALKGRISSMRFSIDGCEPYYSQIRRRPLARLLHNIRNLSDAIPFGINAVVSPGHVGELRRVAELTIAIGALDLLIIPEHRDGNLLLNAREWQEVQETVELYKDRCQLTVTHTAAAHLNAEFLPIEQPADFIFAHISAGRALQLNSYTKTGIPIRDPERMHEYFLTLRDQEKIT